MKAGSTAHAWADVHDTPRMTTDVSDTVAAAGVVDVGVVIVAHNSGAYLQRAVAAVLAQDVALQLVVVDNASTDASLDALPCDSRLTLIRNADNRGFGAACNQGAALGNSALMLFLNPDCELPAGSLAALCELLQANASVGLLGAQLLDSDGSEQAASRRATPRPAHAIRVALGHSSHEVTTPKAAAENSHAAGVLVTNSDSRIEAVDATSGALMLMPRALFTQLGGFDEGYILHCEDLDLCRRVLHAGYAVAIAPQIRVLHHKGTSSRARPVWVEWQKHRGMLRYFRKFDAGTSPWWLRVLVPLGVWARFPLAAARAWRRAHRTG